MWKKCGKRSGGSTALKLFVDTNTIVSGLLFSGFESELLAAGRLGIVRLIASAYVMDEVGRVLRRKQFGLGVAEVADLIRSASSAIEIEPDPNPRLVIEAMPRLDDKKDVPVLVAFETLGCDALVTGDRELLRKVPKAMRTSKALAEIAKSAGDVSESQD